jgi:hypothetical protein
VPISCKPERELFYAYIEHLHAENATLLAALTEIAGWIVPSGLDAQEVALRALKEVEECPPIKKPRPEGRGQV